MQNMKDSIQNRESLKILFIQICDQGSEVDADGTYNILSTVVIPALIILSEVF